MKYLVGTAPVSIPLGGRGRPIIQNLGPGILYLDTDAAATTTDGLELQVGDSFEFYTAGSMETGISVVSTMANTDVRVVTMGA